MVEKIVYRDAIFISQAADQTELFTAVFNQLNHLSYVKGNYASDLQERERLAPTGIAMRPIARHLPNIAVPHLQSADFYRDLLVPIRCQHVLFNDMLTPKTQIPVDFVFLLLTDSAPARTQLLARVVGLLRAVPPEELRVFLTAKSPEQIYAFLNTNLPD